MEIQELFKELLNNILNYDIEINRDIDDAKD